MVRKLKQSTRHKENPQPTLNTEEKRHFTEFWKTLYDDEELEQDNYMNLEGELPTKQMIKEKLLLLNITMS